MSVGEVKQNLGKMKENIADTQAPSQEITEHLGSVATLLAQAAEYSEKAAGALFAAATEYEHTQSPQVAMAERVADAQQFGYAAGLHETDNQDIGLVLETLGNVGLKAGEFGNSIPNKTDGYRKTAQNLSAMSGEIARAGGATNNINNEFFGEIPRVAQGLISLIDNYEAHF
jgi:phage-related tail protein